MKTQRGATLIVVTIALFALIGLAALAIDVGNLYVARNELQNAVDAGALAGARCLYSYAGSRVIFMPNSLCTTTGNPDYGCKGSGASKEINEALNSPNYYHPPVTSAQRPQYCAMVVDDNANSIASGAALANKGGENIQSDKITIQKGHLMGGQFAVLDTSVNKDTWSLDPNNPFDPNDNQSPDFINAIRVQTTIPVNTLFSKVLGIESFQIGVEAVALIGAIGAGEASLPIAVCRDKIKNPSSEECDIATIFDGSPQTGSNTARWTNFAQHDFTADDITTLLAKGCNHVNPVTIVPGSPIRTKMNVSDIGQDNFNKIMDCWQGITGKQKSWEVVLPVVDCSREANGLSPVIGRAKFEILWITGENDTIDTAPSQMLDDLAIPPTTNEWTKSGDGITRWGDWQYCKKPSPVYPDNSFIDQFKLTDVGQSANSCEPPSAKQFPLNSYLAPFVSNSIYFRPRSCFIFSSPVVVK
jgi:hypothetical protein